MIDRISPTRRPAGKVAGYQRWRSLLFLHWPVPVEVLRSLVPAELSLDLHDGVAYVGVVPFAMQGVRPWWCPGAFAFNFLETNVRTYVVAGDRPGVYFFSLDANSRLAVFAARTGWGLPYHYAQCRWLRLGRRDPLPTRRARTGASIRSAINWGEHLEYRCPRRWNISFSSGICSLSSTRGSCSPARCTTRRIRFSRAHLLEVHDELMAAAGFPAACKLPALAHFSPGVDVEIFSLLPTNTVRGQQ